ncbi:hypothetical protein [Alysiella filiformis]|uniref:hypothetical protein n=1 Tax=Alysiella filiformis TaxID=194196 RepID=UPI0015CB4D49|nr:hypothetical protein [Alysiella filiformis]QMT32278.1 hypothetical protein H3L97_05460 [Alysiella filiformis]UBQ56800.1 hypothetical protein JF568_03225 [Alysiella filiformis DSM 16848]
MPKIKFWTFKMPFGCLNVLQAHHFRLKPLPRCGGGRTPKRQPEKYRLPVAWRLAD